MRFTTFAIAGVFLAALFTMAMWPDDARFGAPESSVASTPHDKDPPSLLDSVPSESQLISKSSARDLATEQVLEEVIDLMYEETQFSGERSVNYTFFFSLSALRILSMVHL